MRSLIMSALLSSVALPVQSNAQVAEADKTQTLPQVSPDKSSGMTTDDIFRKMFGRDPDQVEKGSYVVVLDAINSGETEIDPRNGTVSSQFIRDRILPILLPDPAVSMEKLLSSDTVTFDSLRQEGLQVEFDKGQLALVISVPMTMRTARRLAMNSPSIRDRVKFIPQADFSAYVSMRGGFDIVETGQDKGFSGFSSTFDIGANVKGISGYVRLRYDDSGRRKFTRDDARLTYDDTTHLVRYELGDLSIGRRSYQLSPNIAGISAAREFRINPYYQYRTQGEQGFELPEAARVEVLINGAPIRTFNLQAGRYLLSDLPLVASAYNDIELRIVSATGETRTLSFPAFTDIDLLQPGLTEFAVNLGVPYKDEDGVRVYDTHDFNVLGFARRGLTHTLTAGVSLEANKDIALVGGEISWASPIGSFMIDGNIDARNPGMDTSRLQLRYMWRTADTLNATQFDATVLLTGKDYRTLDTLMSGGPVSTFYAQARLGTTLSEDLRVQIGGTYEKVRDPVVGTRWTAGATLLKQIGPASLGANLDYQKDRNRSEMVGRLTLFVPLGRGTLSSNFSTRNDAARIDYNRTVSAGVGSLGWNVGAERTDTSNRQYARANYIANRFELSAEQRRTEARGSTDMRTSFTLGTALVMADGAVAWSRPVTNSFAIVENASGDKTRLAIEPRTGLFGNGMKYSAYADALGSGVVPDLPAYYIRPIDVSPTDMESGVNGEIFQLKPGFRSGYHLKVGQGGSSVSVLANLVDRDGDPVSMVPGEIRESGSKDDAPVQMFTNPAGRFFIEGMKPGATYEALINTPAGPARFEFEVPKDAKGVWRRENTIQLDIDLPKSEAKEESSDDKE
jgi:outer membrane usher protein